MSIANYDPMSTFEELANMKSRRSRASREEGHSLEIAFDPKSVVRHNREKRAKRKRQRTYGRDVFLHPTKVSFAGLNRALASTTQALLD